MVRGLAQPGATITFEIPFWFDQHDVADRHGRWSFVIGLAEGRNELTFRVGDDLSTRQTLILYYEP